MSETKPKNNKCEIEFICNHSIDEPCVYFTGKTECLCKSYFNCNSVIARVDALRKELNELIME